MASERSIPPVIFLDLSIRIALLMIIAYTAFQNIDYAPYSENFLGYSLMVAKGFY